MPLLQYFENIINNLENQLGQAKQIIDAQTKEIAELKKLKSNKAS